MIRRYRECDVREFAYIKNVTFPCDVLKKSHFLFNVFIIKYIQKSFIYILARDSLVRKGEFGVKKDMDN